MEDYERRLPTVEDVLEHFQDLTQTEARAFLLVGQGLSNKEIAEELHVSHLTVRSYVKHVYEKLELKGRARLAVAASRLMNFYA